MQLLGALFPVGVGTIVFSGDFAVSRLFFLKPASGATIVCPHFAAQRIKMGRSAIFLPSKIKGDSRVLSKIQKDHIQNPVLSYSLLFETYAL